MCVIFIACLCDLVTLKKNMSLYNLHELEDYAGEECNWVMRLAIGRLTIEL